MALEWLRQPTGDDESNGPEGRGNLVRWVAVGVADVQEAITEGLPIEFNDPHPDLPGDPRRAISVRVVANGFRVMAAEARFSVPKDGTEHESTSGDVTKPLVYSWQTAQETVAADRDSAGNAILYSSGRAPSGITGTKNYKRLTVTRWETSYSVATSLVFENTVNSAVFEGGAIGSVKCSTIQPSAAYNSNAALIPIDYVFDYKSPTTWGANPWDLRFLDQDSYATIAGNKKVRIVTASGEQVTDTPLDGQGRPVDTTLTYFENPTDVSPKATPAWVALTTPTGATVIAAGSVKFLSYAVLPSANFNSLGL